jgi:hypothetical protein
MLDLTYHEDGRVTVNRGADPGVQSIAGWSRHSVGCDLGRNDPTALVVVKDECLPVLKDELLVLGPRRRTAVYHETIAQTSYTDIANYLSRFLFKLRAWVLTIDASGLGGPFSDQLLAAGIEHWAVTMTGGEGMNRNGYKVSCSKNLLLETMASGFETGDLMIAGDLPQKDLLLQEIASFELATTSAGNLVLQGGGKGHHADRAVACALAYLQTERLQKSYVGVGRLRGYF